MSREILFRGKRIDNGEWVEGGYAENDGKAFIAIRTRYIPDTRDWDTAEYYENNPCYCLTMIEVEPETVCQYTNLTDKNGKKIFEGDIIFVVEKMGSDVFQNGILIGSPRWVNKIKFIVEFTPEGLMNTQRFCNSKAIECEVIGNIFDNKELINQ